jgi:IS4 transposase
LSLGLSLGAVSHDQGGREAAHAARSARQYPGVSIRIHISDGKMHEVNILDRLLPEAGAFYVMDRGYLDFERLFRLHSAGSFFVIRGKSNLKAQRRYSRPVDRSTGFICDQTVVLTGFYSSQSFETPLRRIRFNDPKTSKRLVFLTNNFALPALTITELYRCRWQVELFFKWIKQHLRIKQFLWHDRERCEDADLDRRLDLRARRHRQKAIEDPSQPLRNATNPEPDHVRANPFGYAAFANQRPSQRYP